MWACSRVRKSNSAHFQCKGSINPVAVHGDFISSPLLHMFVSFLFLPSVLDLSSSCLPVTDFLGQKHPFAAGLRHLQASRKIQEPGPIMVWNRNPKVLELLRA